MEHSTWHAASTALLCHVTATIFTLLNIFLEIQNSSTPRSFQFNSLHKCLYIPRFIYSVKPSLEARSPRSSSRQSLFVVDLEFHIGHESRIVSPSFIHSIYMSYDMIRLDLCTFVRTFPIFLSWSIYFIDLLLLLLFGDLMWAYLNRCNYDTIGNPLASGSF